MSLTLFCLHSNGCFHGDIKPANILISNKHPAKLNYYLTDYGEGKCIHNFITSDYETLSFLVFYLIYAIYYLFL